jgi:hypothetical protein
VRAQSWAATAAAVVVEVEEVEEVAVVAVVVAGEVVVLARSRVR